MPVFPQDESQRHTPCYKVDNEMNLVMAETSDGQTHLFGPAPGAGARPTGASILRDLDTIIKEGMECLLVDVE